MNNRKEFLFGCDCGCSKLTIEKDEDDDYVYLSHYTSSFYAKQSVIKDRIIERIKMIWFALLGKDFYLYDIVITPEKWEEFKNWLEEI